MTLQTNDAGVYDLNQVRAAFSGVPLNKGPGQNGYTDSGDVFSIKKADKSFKHKIGLDGHFVRYATNVTVYLVVFSLMQDSSTNEILSTIHANDVATTGGQGIGSLTIEDLNGSSVFESQFAYIDGEPEDITYSAEPGDRKWTFVCTKVKNFVGATT